MKRPNVTREDQAAAELGHTVVSRRTAMLIMSLFLVSIGAVPILETGGDLRANLQVRRELLLQGVPWDHLPARRPKVLDVIDFIPPPSALLDPLLLNQALPAPRKIRQYEDRMVNGSRVGLVVRPWAQTLLTEWLGVGSQSVSIARDGSLFYPEGVRYTTQAGFLEDVALASQRSAGIEMPDPRPAILQAHRELAAVGVRLLVLPIPDKSMVQAGRLTARELAGTVPQNPSWPRFLADLRNAGVVVVDVAQEMYDAERAGSIQFLRTDSHWTPAGVSVTANAVAARLRSLVDGRDTSRRYHQVVERIEKRGDLATLLGLPPSRREALYPPESLELRRVVDSDGEPWQPDPNSQVVFIGDSFLESYSTPESGDPVGAGLAEQVSFLLQLPLDRIASHRGRAYGERQALGQTLGEFRRAGQTRRVVVWEFAIRKLAVEDWRLLPGESAASPR